MGAIRARLGPVGLTGAKLWGFEVTMRQHEYELICIKTPICFANNLPPFNPQKWFFIQNVHRDLSFQEKQAQLRLCKLGPGTVLIFYKTLAPTPIYM